MKRKQKVQAPPPPPPAAVDRDGWPIVTGARIYRRPRPHPWFPGTEYELPGISGFVLGMKWSEKYSRWLVTVREVETFSLRSVFADDCRVQRNDSKKSFEHRVVEAKLAGKRVRVKRGKKR